MADDFGIGKLVAALAATAGKAELVAVTIVKRGQVVVEDEAKRQFTGAHPPGTPTTSRPGAPPDVVTGTLRRSIKSDTPQRSGLGGAIGRVYPTAIYARIQELGGQTGRGGHTTLPARPYMQPALEKAKPALQRIAVEEWSGALPH